MKVQINSDKQIAVNDVLSALVQGEVDRALGRFEDRLTRVEVHLSDLNGPKEGPLADKRSNHRGAARGMAAGDGERRRRNHDGGDLGGGEQDEALETAVGRAEDKRDKR